MKNVEKEKPNADMESMYCDICNGGKSSEWECPCCNRIIKEESSKLKNLAERSEVPQCEAERYWFKNILFQRLHKDSLWYAIHNNQIIDWDRYRHDLEERLRDFA